MSQGSNTILYVNYVNTNSGKYRTNEKTNCKDENLTVYLDDSEESKQKLKFLDSEDKVKFPSKRDVVYFKNFKFKLFCELRLKLKP